MPRWLFDQLRNLGDQPEPRFALQGTVNWMRALSILIEYDGLNVGTINNLFGTVNRRNPNIRSDTLAFENIAMSLHHLSGLKSMARQGPAAYGVVRIAIVSWHYAIYDSCQAMINASSGSTSDTHAKTARIWQADIVNQTIVPHPFRYSITNLTQGSIDLQNRNLRQGNTYDVNTEPTNRDEAYGAIISYLKGTAEWDKWNTEQKVRSSADFRRLGVVDFRTNAARQLRDASLAARCVNFLDQAFRYRGKANYRDSIYLSYGDDNTEKVELFLSDLDMVATVFVALACKYVSKRTIRGSWQNFVDDMALNARFILPFDLNQI